MSYLKTGIGTIVPLIYLLRKSIVLNEEVTSIHMLILYTPSGTPSISRDCFLTLTHGDITVLTERSEVNKRVSRACRSTRGTLTIHLSSKIQ